MSAETSRQFQVNDRNHPALNRTWWLNLYPDGQCTGTLCQTCESALNRCTYSGDKPDAIQVEVRIVPVSAAYEAWFDEVKRIAWLMNWPPPAIASIDKNAWEEYFADGSTPAEAWKEELNAAL